MTDQVLSGNGQHQVGQQGASSEWLVREVAGSRGAAGGQQGGSRVETLTDHGRCCFVWLLGYQQLTDGVCDNVLDVVEGIAGETVIELTQEEKGNRERYDSDKKMYT
jgi:hypothetical protein